MIRRFIWVSCLALALCATQGISVHASELHEDEFYIYYETGIYDKSSDTFFPLSEFSSESDQTDSSDPAPELDSSADDPVSDDFSLSDKHLSILDALGDLLEYHPTGDEESIDLDSVEDDVFGADGSDYDSSVNDSDVDSSVLSGIADDVSLMSDIMLYSNQETFYGNIPSTYLEYMRGFLGKLPFNYHYVAYRQGQYLYSFVFGEELSYDDNGHFSGTDIVRITWNTYSNGSYSIYKESSFTLNCGTNMVYTDLGYDYPALVDYGGYQTIQIKWVLLISVLSFWMISLYKGYRRRGDRDSKYAHSNAK